MSFFLQTNFPGISGWLAAEFVFQGYIVLKGIYFHFTQCLQAEGILFALKGILFALKYNSNSSYCCHKLIITPE